MSIGAGLIEESEEGFLYNTYVVAMSDGTYAKHRKLHCFISGHIKSGDSYTVFDTPQGIRMGNLTCYDNNKTRLAELEAEFRGPKGRLWFMGWLPSRAHDNGMFLLFGNGVGKDDGEVRTGGAMILDPYGGL